jgi:hypothetical protein
MNAPAPRAGIPLVPDKKAASRAAATSIVRAVLASARATFESNRDGAALRLARAAWPDDRLARAIVTRATSAPAMTTVTGWAAELAATRVEDLLSVFGPASCGAALLRRGTVLSWGGANKISIPGISTASASFASFVGQGAPIPTRQMTTTAGVSLTPAKFATIFALTREMVESSNAEALVRLVMADSLSVALDAALFSNVAGSATQPAGLLYNITPIGAATGGGAAAMTKDFAALITSVSAVSALDIVFITDPGTMAKIKMSVMPGFDYDVLASNAVPVGTVICVGLNGLVSVAEPQPRIDASRDIEVPVAMDTAPPSDGSIGSVVLKSMFQVDEIAIRFIADMTWGLRTPAALAFTQNITW